MTDTEVNMHIKTYDENLQKFLHRAVMKHFLYKLGLT